jgi:hypothetical protein
VPGRRWGTRQRAARLGLDATLVEVHSDNQQAAGHFKRGFGYHPVLALLDNINEALAGDPAPGNTGASTAADHLRQPATLPCITSRRTC